MLSVLNTLFLVAHAKVTVVKIVSHGEAKLIPEGITDGIRLKGNADNLINAVGMDGFDGAANKLFPDALVAVLLIDCGVVNKSAIAVVPRHDRANV